MKTTVKPKLSSKRQANMASPASPGGRLAVLQGSKLSLILSFVAVLVFLFLWFVPPSVKVVDPWFRAAKLIDSSRSIPDPAARTALLDEAGRQLAFYNQQHPYHARIWMLRGYYFMEKKAWDSALYCHRKAIEIGKGGTVNQVEFQAAELYCDVLSAKVARLTFGDTATANVLLPLTRFNGFDDDCLIRYRGIIYTNTNQTDSAIYYLSKLSKLNDGEVHYFLGYNYAQKGQYDLAVQNLERSLSIRSDYAPASALLQEIKTRTR